MLQPSQQLTLLLILQLHTLQKLLLLKLQLMLLLRQSMLLTQLPMLQT